MTTVALAIQVYAITRSSFAVGVVGICAFFPLVVFGLYGGAIADSMDRRRLALVASTGLWLLSIVLATQALAGLRSVLLLYVVAAVQAACYAVNNPARAAIIPRLLPPPMLPAANALSTASFNLGFTVGPLPGGVVIGWLGLGAAYLVDCVTFTAALYALFRLPPVPPEGDVRRAGLQSVLEGLRYLRTRPNVLMTFLVDMCAMVLAQPRALFPAIAGGLYGGGTRTVGLLAASPAIGSLVAVVFSGPLGLVRRQGRAILVCVVAYGAAVAAFGLAPALWLGVLFLAVSGAADMVSSVFRNTILQVATPDAMRGRLQGVFIVVAGGCACMVAVGMLAARYRGFARYDAADPRP
jgi:MFS family permease